MQQTVREKIRATLDGALTGQKQDRQLWVTKFPGQCLVTVSEILWAANVTKALLACQKTGDITALTDMQALHAQMLGEYSKMIGGNLTHLQRLKLVSIVTKEVHARDVNERLISKRITSPRAFDWAMQLRQYWEVFEDGREHVTIRQVNTLFRHCYEYLGCSSRLVISPLTDRCYMTLTSALNLFRGGSPKGPAGTGKTETVKDLGKSMGTYVVVVNCSEGLNYRAIGKMFSGLAQSGAWGCFDEFNRINVEVLSVVAQQILSILRALRSGQTKFMFEGKQIPLVPSVGVFITMNPGYAGRTELPDNLKSMFRPIAMVAPDSVYIAEILLFGEGFSNTKDLARKVCTLYELSSQQLSKQYHYDFGLRSMTALLRYAGTKRRANRHLTEEQVLLMAMKDANMPRMVEKDMILFESICGDLFPSVELVVFNFDELIAEIECVMAARNLQRTDAAITKALELYETKNTRHAVMLVGPTMSGKSTCWKILMDSLTNLSKRNPNAYNPVEVYTINPKALNEAELYGDLNFSTGEWTDGIISATMRKICEDKSLNQKWLLFDGPVDSVWIENMNSVMDDNKLLTLVNGERISMPEQVSLLFETENLAEASPATVSRCGVVYFDVALLGWQPLVSSWLNTKDKVLQDELSWCFSNYYNQLMEFKCQNESVLVEIDDGSATMSMFRLFDCLLSATEASINENNRTKSIRMMFLYCVTWSLCAVFDDEGRRTVDTRIREMDKSIPRKDTVYEYFVNVEKSEWIHWEMQLDVTSWTHRPEIPFYRLIVPTVDTLRYNYMISLLLNAEHPTLIIGHIGTGKSSISHSIISEQDPSSHKSLVIYASAQTSSRNIQVIIESNLERVGRNLYGPKEGKRLVTLIDDINMPKTDTYGSQPALELIRMWLNEKFWYNRSTLQPSKTKDISLIATMSTSSGGRNSLPNRLRSKFNVLGILFPSESEIRRIYSTLLRHKMLDTPYEVSKTLENVILATLSLYKAVEKTFLPIPSKVHYAFNMRDIGRIVEGLLLHDHDEHSSRQKTLRLWVHEATRVFGDRMVNEEDKEAFSSVMNEQLMIHFNILLYHVCPPRHPVIFTHLFGKKSTYIDYETKEAMDELRKKIYTTIAEYNSSPNVIPADIVLFSDALQHLLRICRVISRPKGNMLLLGIGGSGRRSLCRLAAYLCGYGCFELQISKHYGIFDFKEDLRRLYKMAGINDRGTVFLLSDTQIVDIQFLEDLNNILNSGCVPNLFGSEDMVEIRNGLEKIAEREGMQTTDSAILEFMLDRVKSNLHLLLCMSPSGSTFRNYVRMFPPLITCTTIDYFDYWPVDGLMEVSIKHFADVDLSPYNERKKGIHECLSSIHLSVSNLSKQMLTSSQRQSHTTPTNFLDFLKTLRRFLLTKRVSVEAEKKRLISGLAKVDETRVIVTDASLNLGGKHKIVTQYQDNCEQFLVQLEEQQSDATEKQKAVAVLSRRLAEEEVTCRAIAELAETELREAMPMLERANEALNSLSKKDISEIRSYSRPPVAVEKVMGAVLILKQKEPTWEEAKRDLGDINFVKSLINFDKNHIPEKVLRKITQIVKSPMFDAEEVGKKSFAAKSVCTWVIAMEAYAQVFKLIKPKMDNYQRAAEVLGRKQRDLNNATTELDKIHQKIKELQKNYDAKLKEKDELQRDAKETGLFLDRAKKLLDGVARKRLKWKKTAEELASYDRYLVGDSILSVAFACYMGAFTPDYRDQVIGTWQAMLEKKQIQYSQHYSFVKHMSQETDIREWTIKGLPRDQFSTENAIIFHTNQRYPLFIDPQSQAVKWLRQMKRSQGLVLTDPRQTDFMNKIERCIAAGRPCLCHNISNEIPVSLEPILARVIRTDDQGKQYLTIGDKEVPYDDKFRLFLTTRLSNPHYTPEVFSKTVVINFSIKEEGLEEQLLAILVKQEKPQIEMQKNDCIVSIAAKRKEKQTLEDTFLRLLNDTEGSLLENLDVFDALDHSNKMEIEIGEALIENESVEAEIDSAREQYRPCAKRSSILFFALNDMGKIDPMYQYSLDSYFELFVMSIEKSLRSSLVVERIKNINHHHTFSAYRYGCRGLFERHKLLFSSQMCTRILFADGLIEHDEHALFLQTSMLVEKRIVPQNPLKSFLPDTLWADLQVITKLRRFRSMAVTFTSYSEHWKKWYQKSDPERYPLPGGVESVCGNLSRLLVLKFLRPDRVAFGLSGFIEANFGKQFMEPPLLELKSVYSDSTRFTPIIFILSAGVDPSAMLIQFAEDMHMSNKLHILSLGQGQSPKAVELLEMGKIKGHWIFLANCHLSESWLPYLDHFIDQLQGNRMVHRDFRLWLSSTPIQSFPIGTLQLSIKITTEPPRGIRTNMLRMYNQLEDRHLKTAARHMKFRRIIFPISFLHALVLERKKFLNLGWNNDYSFNDSDYEISISMANDLIRDYTEATPWDALRYMIASVIYGGHVTDKWDMRLLETYAEDLFEERLFDIVNNPTYALSNTTNAYLVPKDTAIPGYISHLNNMPAIDQAEAFGQHGNAYVATQVIISKALIGNLSYLQHEDAHTTSTEIAGKDDQILRTLTDILRSLPKPIEVIPLETTSIASDNASGIDPLKVVFDHEVERYNHLLKVVQNTTRLLQQSIQGTVLLTEELENILICIRDMRVPDVWKKCYKSVKPLGSWLQDLNTRVSKFADWARLQKPPAIFWLSGFSLPNGFLTALLQMASRRQKVAIDTLQWKFNFQDRSEKGMTIASTVDKTVMSGFYLEGAEWNDMHRCLTEPQHMKIHRLMPYIIFSAVVPDPHITSPVTYACPCFQTSDRSTSYVVTVDIDPGKQYDPSHWIKRAIALVLSSPDDD